MKESNVLSLDPTKADLDERLEFTNACTKFSEAHQNETKKLDNGEAHIAIDRLAGQDEEGKETVAVLVCANVCSRNKFDIMDAVMEGLGFDDLEKITYFMTNVKALI